MELELQRTTGLRTEDTCISKLLVNGKFECYILEDKDRGLTSMMSLEQINKLKVYGETCIPYGKYEIDLTLSARFKKVLPILLGVKGYEGVRIHTGNTKADTLGCLLPCTSFGINAGVGSTIAFNKLFAKMKEAKNNNEKIYINII
jgi:hypothetical protein